MLCPEKESLGHSRWPYVSSEVTRRNSILKQDELQVSRLVRILSTHKPDSSGKTKNAPHPWCETWGPGHWLGPPGVINTCAHQGLLMSAAGTREKTSMFPRSGTLLQVSKSRAESSTFFPSRCVYE